VANCWICNSEVDKQGKECLTCLLEYARTYVDDDLDMLRKTLSTIDLELSRKEFDATHPNLYATSVKMDYGRK
jgi:hypothetical protein